MPSSASVDIAAGDVGDAQQHVEVGERQHEHAEHPVGAVDQRQALLGPQRERCDAGGGERGGAVDERAVGAGAPAPSPSSTRALDASGARSPLAPSEPCSRTTGVTPAVQQGEHRLDDDGPGAGVPHRQAAGAQEHHRPHDLALDLRSHAGGVRADQRRLQLGRALGAG